MCLYKILLTLFYKESTTTIFNNDIFNNFFSTVFTNDDGKLPTFPKATKVRSADDIDFSPMAVSRALKKLKPGGAAGPDLFPALF